jgi:hypothetical protein
VLCSRIPTRTVTIRRHVGMVLVQRFFRISKPLCREHGTATAKQFLGKTVVQGWWGVISFFVNFFAVGTDIVAYFAYRRLPEPRPSPTMPGRPLPMSARKSL